MNTCAPSMSGLTLKVELDGEVRRFRGWLKDGANPTVQSLRNLICDLFGVMESHLSDVKYRDDEGDLCTLIDATLSDALDMAKSQSNVLRLTCSASRDARAAVSSAVDCAEVAATAESEYTIVQESTAPSFTIGSQTQDVAMDPNQDNEARQNGGDDLHASTTSSSVIIDEAEDINIVHESTAPALPIGPHDQDVAMDPDQETEARQDDGDDQSASTTSSSAISDEDEHVGTNREATAPTFLIVQQTQDVAMDPDQDNDARVDDEDGQRAPTTSSATRDDDENARGPHSFGENVPEYPAELHCKLVERLQRAQPQLVEGLTHFKQQIISDFQSTRDDMKCAFDASQSSSADLSQQPPAIRKIGNVTSNAVAAIVAGRLIPVRTVRLAAHGFAAVTNVNDAADAVAQDTAEPAVAAAMAPNSESATLPRDEEDYRRDDVTHFRHQIAHDFHNARQEVSAAFQCVLGKNSPQVTESTVDDTAAASNGAGVEPKPSLKDMVPIVAGMIAGCTVAASLAPVRAVRLAVASAAAQASNTQLTEAQIEADEQIARRLQAEWAAEHEE